MQYYRLKDQYILRGWDKLPYAIVDTASGDPEFLTAEKWQAVELCDGSVDVSVPYISDAIKKTI